MTFEDLQHIVRASAALLGDQGLLDPDQREFVIVGSAAILVLAHDHTLPAMATRPSLVSGRGLAIERHDLAASKLAAGRIKDLEFVGALIAAGILDVPTIRERLNAIPPGPGRPARIAAARKWLAGR